MANDVHLSAADTSKFSVGSVSGFNSFSQGGLKVSSHYANPIGAEDRQTLLKVLETDLTNIRDRLAKHGAELGALGVRIMGHIPEPGMPTQGGVAPDPVAQMDRLASIVTSLRYFMDEAESAASRLNNVG